MLEILFLLLFFTLGGCTSPLQYVIEGKIFIDGREMIDDGIPVIFAIDIDALADISPEEPAGWNLEDIPSENMHRAVIHDLNLFSIKGLKKDKRYALVSILDKNDDGVVEPDVDYVFFHGMNENLEEKRFLPTKPWPKGIDDHVNVDLRRFRNITTN